MSASLAFLRNLLFWSNLCLKETYRQGIPEMPSAPLPSVRSTEMQKATLSPLVAVRTTPRTTPLQRLSLVYQEEEGWKAKLATQSREQDFPVSKKVLGFQTSEENSVPRNEGLQH